MKTYALRWVEIREGTGFRRELLRAVPVEHLSDPDPIDDLLDKRCQGLGQALLFAEQEGVSITDAWLRLFSRQVNQSVNQDFVQVGMSGDVSDSSRTLTE